MNLGTAPILLRGLILFSSIVSSASHADWVTSPLARVVRPLPADAQVQAQNPPGFTWAMPALKPPNYILEVTGPSGVRTYTTTRNWYLPSEPLAAGTYSWRARPSNSTVWSSPRAFSINDATSKKFLVPDDTLLKQRIISRARPRSLSASLYPRSSWSATMAAERSPALSTLIAQVQWRAKSIPIYKDANWPLVNTGTVTAASNAQASAIRWAILDLTRQFEAAAFLWRMTADRQYLNEALTRGAQVAAFSPTGPTGLLNADQETRVITLALIKSIDLLAGDLEPAVRAFWLNVVKLRTNDMFAAFKTADGGLDQFPFDSHGTVAQGYLAAISVLAMGDIPEATEWFDFTFRAYVHSIYPWSGSEGGFANGTSYGQHAALSSMAIWQPIAAATGVNLFGKPWADGYLRFFMHFQPPGATRHTFGDEHEAAPVPTELKGFASRFATPTAAWYVKSLSGDEDPLSLLAAPWPLPVNSVATPQPPPNAALYPSIGWVAMHSDISNRARTSVYFKSSPYGSFNHSHADQNSLLVTSGGRPLLIETGWYDWYGSPLWRDWYRQTKAHNAITFDGGKGQLVDGFDKLLSRNGKVTSFSTSSSLDYTDGDATAAYDGALTSAKRQLWYLRAQDLVVVRDTLASATARVFEWNLHAAAPLVVDANNMVKITNIDRTLCVRSVTPNAIFGKRVGAPSKTGTYEDHGAFALPAALTAEFLMVLDIGCKNPLISLTTTATGRRLAIGGAAITLPK
ncbi:hypothetical protein ACFDR9_001286 [Janthinobacterium sp. CG_23.3]|uniref:heparinase II/III domain-containing protein n=1 Tax=Janthinobacterium sp. CG_23.3 TaxID=3349634 RepID=UPI0038D4CDE3